MDAKDAYTILEFCQRHGISRSKLYQLWDAGIGPRKMNIGNKVLISVEAAADWRLAREAASATKAA
jgi:predicted DNA-binding transcriptional regulator AlpA